MPKYFTKIAKNQSTSSKSFLDKTVKRFQDNATRLEHNNVRNKNKNMKANNGSRD